MSWHNLSRISSLRYTCGHCNSLVASDHGYFAANERPIESAVIHICPHCDRPTYFVFNNSGLTMQLPAAIFGRAVEHLPAEIQPLYDEARRCVGIAAYTAAVMLCRKLLMHIAVEKGAGENQSFKAYVDYLDSNGYLPPDSKDWVNHIRNQGNEANHEILLKAEGDATELIEFIEMITKFIYEFPVRVSNLLSKSDGPNQ